MRLPAFVFLLITSTCFSQNVKGLYVDGFSTILGIPEKEDSLLRFAENNGFNYLTLYQMHIVNANTPLNNVVSAQVFADFVEKAKTQFSIDQIGVASENFTAFNTVYHIYNQQHPDPNQKIDVYNLEFEFWVPSSVETGGVYCDDYLQPNGIPCDTSGAFSFFETTLHKIDSLAFLDGAVSETYFGWFNDGQGIQIIETGIDRILLSAYMPSASYSPAYQYNYLRTRLESLTLANEPVKILPIYSAEDSFMHDWAVSNPFFEPYSDFQNSISSETDLWAQYIEPEGIQWFAYTDMPKKNMDLNVARVIKDQIVICPNPSTGDVTILCQDEFTQLRVFTSEGKEFLSCKNLLNTTLYNLKPGVYFFEISDNHHTIVRKVTVE